MWKRFGFALAALLVAAVAFPVFAGDAASQPLTSGQDRLFLSFPFEAAVVDAQWWEGRIEITSDAPPGGNLDLTVLRGIAAFRVNPNLEVGGTFGFGDTDGPGNALDGSGATDLDLWGKWKFKPQGENEFAVGAIATVPTGDDGAGLGRDAFDIGAFGSVRRRLDAAILSAYAGFRFNGDGKIRGVDLNGDFSAFAGAGILRPINDEFSVVGEAYIETGRFDEFDADVRVLVGANWRAFSRGTFRGALQFGLADGAPDAQLLLGYAYNF